MVVVVVRRHQDKRQGTLGCVDSLRSLPLGGIMQEEWLEPSCTPDPAPNHHARTLVELTIMSFANATTRAALSMGSCPDMNCNQQSKVVWEV